MPALLALIVRIPAARTEASPMPSVTLLAVLFSWLLWRGFCNLRVNLAWRAFDESYDRLYDAMQAYRNAPGPEQLGQARAAAAYSCFRWQRVMLLDGESEPDRSWQCMLTWVRRWERRYS